MTGKGVEHSWSVEIATGIQEVDSKAAVTHRQTNLGGWVSEWEGAVEGEELFVQVFYGSPDDTICEVRIEGWIFDGVRLEDVREMLATVISGDVVLRKSLLGSWKLTASMPSVVYTASARDRGPVPDSDWERRAIARGKSRR